MKFFDFSTLLLILGLINFSCKREDRCSSITPISPMLTAGFYTSAANSEITKPDTIKYYLENLTVQGIGQKDSLYINKTSIQQIALPINFTADSSAFVFIMNTRRDTLTVKYEKGKDIISLECGFGYKYHNVSYSSSKNVFKNLIPLQNTIADEKVHLKILF